MLRRALSTTNGRNSTLILVLILLLSVFGPLLAPYPPLTQDLTNINQPPSSEHWLGTDGLGRDVLSRLLAGAPLSLFSALEAVMIGFVLGVAPGILSVFLGRTFEWITLRLMDSLLTLPFIVFAIAMSALLGNGLHQAMFAVGVLLAPIFYRVTRAATLEHAHMQYVEAARLFGANTWWIITKHIASKVTPTVSVAVAGLAGGALTIVSSLTFLGIGVAPPEPTWGGLLATDLQYLYDRPWGPIAPALLIVLTVGACNGLADALRDATGGRRGVGRRRRSPLRAAGVPRTKDSGDRSDAQTAEQADRKEEVTAGAQ